MVSLVQVITTLQSTNTSWRTSHHKYCTTTGLWKVAGNQWSNFNDPSDKALRQWMATLQEQSVVCFFTGKCCKSRQWESSHENRGMASSPCMKYHYNRFSSFWGGTRVSQYVTKNP